MDSVKRFIDTQAELAPHERTGISVIKEAYKDWCRDEGLRPLAASQFNSALEDHGCRQGKSGSVTLCKRDSGDSQSHSRSAVPQACLTILSCRLNVAGFTVTKRWSRYSAMSATFNWGRDVLTQSSFNSAFRTIRSVSHDRLRGVISFE